MKRKPIKTILIIRKVRIRSRKLIINWIKDNQGQIQDRLCKMEDFKLRSYMLSEMIIL